MTFDRDGNAYGFTVDGRVIQIDLTTGAATEWAYIGGRPLAGEFDVHGDLYVCDSVKGLLHVDHQTRVVSIAAARTNDGVPILFADDIGTTTTTPPRFFLIIIRYDACNRDCQGWYSVFHGCE